MVWPRPGLAPEPSRSTGFHAGAAQKPGFRTWQLGISPPVALEARKRHKFPPSTYQQDHGARRQTYRDYRKADCIAACDPVCAIGFCAPGLSGPNSYSRPARRAATHGACFRACRAGTGGSLRSASCPLCQEIVHAGVFVTPVIASLPLQLDWIVFVAATVLPDPVTVQRSLNWQSRAPPRH